MKQLVRVFAAALLALPLVAFAQSISMDDLQKEMKSNKNLVILGIDAAGGKLPGSRMIDAKKIRQSSNVPDAKSFEAMMQAEGVNSDSKVVIVEEGTGSGTFAPAARLYWTFKYYGFDNVAILSGGLQEWTDMGGEVSDKAPGKAKAGNFAAQAPRSEIYASAEDVKAAIGKKTIVDVRDIASYIGLNQKKGNKQAGHIDTAETADLTLYFKTGSTLHDKAALEKLFKDLKIDLSKGNITYCNSGNQAAVGWYVLSEVLGQKASLYDGSMKEWDGPVSNKLQN